MLLLALVLPGLPLLSWAAGDNVVAGASSRNSFDAAFAVDILTLFVLAVTAGTIVWYTVETRRLRLATEKTREEEARVVEIELHPWLVGSDLTTRASPGMRPAIFLPMKNVGKAPAFNLELYGQYYVRDMAHGEVSQKLGFLAPGDVADLLIMAHSDIPEEGRGGRIVVTVTYTAHPKGSGVIKQEFAYESWGWSTKDASYTVTLSTGEKISR